MKSRRAVRSTCHEIQRQKVLNKALAVCLKSLLPVGKRDDVCSQGNWRVVKITIDRNRQYKHTKSTWTHRLATYQTAVCAMSSSLQHSYKHKEVIAAAIMHANKPDRLMRLDIDTCDIHVILFSKTFSQLSDFGCFRCFQFCQRSIIRLVHITA